MEATYILQTDECETEGHEQLVLSIGRLEITQVYLIYCTAGG
jgi:hypothetical protein